MTTRSEITPIRFGGAEFCLVQRDSPEGFERRHNGLLDAYRTAGEAQVAYPDAAPSTETLDLDAVAWWCAEAESTIESVDQSEDFGFVVCFLDSLEESGLLNEETIAKSRAANGAVWAILSANFSFTAMLPELNRNELALLRRMFASGLRCLARALPEDFRPKDARSS